jgi:siroheme synthase-like protein
MTPRRLPIFLDLSHRRILIVGGGRAAERKLPALLETGARITLIASQIRPAVRQRLWKHALYERPATLEDVTSDYALFFPLTNDRDVNQALTTSARKAGVLVAGCSDQQDSDFFMGALVERGPVRIAISTDGHSPALARELAAWLRSVLPSRLSAPSDPGAPDVGS